MTDFNGYTITTDKSLMNMQDIYYWLSEEAYWCKGIPFELFNRTFDNSFCIGALIDGKQVAYARLITDYATFAYLADVYVEEEHRGKGISKKMMEILFDLDWVKGLRRIMLATKDAHGLYEQYGFGACKYPDRIMEISRPNIYEPAK
jgi:GNAT superfamily N-acetyltransferase